MKQQHFDYLMRPKDRVFTEPRQRITYSYNNVESTIVGQVEEDGNLIHLYEYRGKYFGTEFLISFSKDSAYYKLVQVDRDEEEDVMN